MDAAQSPREVEQLIVEWNALRVTETYRRANFTVLRDRALGRWEHHGPHTEVDTHFVQYRVGRGAQALIEIVELEERSDLAFAACQSDFAAAANMSEKDRETTLSRIRDVSSRAIREDMRYRTTLLGTFRHEVNELVTFIDDRLAEIAG